MERIRDDKKVLDELKEREMLQKSWELYEAGIRPNTVKSTIITSKEVHNLLENMAPLEEPYKSAQDYYEYVTQMIKTAIEGLTWDNSQDVLKEMKFLEEIELLKEALKIHEQGKNYKVPNLTRRKIRENL